MEVDRFRIESRRDRGCDRQRAILFGRLLLAGVEQGARLSGTVGRRSRRLQIMTELSFQLPEVSIAVEATEARRLFEELDRLGARLTGQDYARLARRIGTAAHERSVHAVELLDVRPVSVSYRLELAYLDGRQEHRDLISLSGSYSVGDLIPAPAGECWQVVGVEPEEDRPTRLMCDPC